MNNKPKVGIAVDGWCSGNPGQGGYKAVDIETEEVLFEWKSDYITNNLAEFIGLVHTIMWCEKYQPKKYIWTDSITAISWVRNGKAKTKMDMSKSSDVAHRLKVSEDFLFNKSMSHIKKWDTKLWGEIPADFGNKK